jgi:N-acetyl-anhydromuramyl-L-alanine amidase AmpD
MSKNHTTESDILPINTDFPINNKYKSINFNSRIRQIIIHYTAEDTQKSFDTLLGKDKNKVSAHYIINNALTEKYPDFIYQIVSDSKRSWHAGVSTWGNDSDLNNSSIGIEIVNLDGNVDAYPEEQFQAVVFLVKKLKQLYKVKDVDIIGHSDIAPSRKVDPGKLFPWERLAKSGASAWYDESDVEYFRSTLETAPNDEIGKCRQRPL